MGIFVTSANLLPVIQNALTSALAQNPSQIPNVQQEASNRATGAIQQLTMQIAWPRLLVAAVIAAMLLAGAIWAAKTNLTNISTELMTSFQSFSGIVVGLLGGEVAASKK
jgi:uncharacterized membrane protein YgcG